MVVQNTINEHVSVPSVPETLAPPGKTFFHCKEYFSLITFFSLKLWTDTSKQFYGGGCLWIRKY